jgi:hypothetical protein
MVKRNKPRDCPHSPVANPKAYSAWYYKNVTKVKTSKTSAALVILVFLLALAPPALAAPIRWEYLNTTADGAQGLGTQSIGQTFLVGGTSHTVTSIKLLLYRIGEPGTITLYLKATSSGLPTGGVLSSGTLDGDEFTDDTGGEWETFNMSLVTLSASTLYCIYIVGSGDGSNKAMWQADGSSPSYSDGNEIYSAVPAVTWAAYTPSDQMFEIWGNYLIQSQTSTYGSTTIASTTASTTTTVTPATSTLSTTKTGGTSTIVTSTTNSGTGGTSVNVYTTIVKSSSLSVLNSITEPAAGTLTGYETTTITSSSTYSTTTCDTFTDLSTFSTTTCDTFTDFSTYSTTTCDTYIVTSSITSMLGLVFHLPFDNSSVPSLDASDNHNDATTVEAEWVSDHGGAYSFNGTGYLIIPTSDSIRGINATDEFSFSIWIKGNGSWAGTDGQEIFFSNNGGPAPPSYISINDSNGNVVLVSLQVYDGFDWVELAADGLTPFAASEWTHLVVTWDGTLKIYVNNVLDNVPVYVGGDIDFTGDLNFGIYQLADLQGFSGFLDEPRLYNYAISSDEVQILFNQFVNIDVTYTTCFTTCETSIYSSTDSTTFCETTVNSSTFTSCVTTSITETDVTATICKTSTDTVLTCESETSTITDTTSESYTETSTICETDSHTIYLTSTSTNNVTTTTKTDTSTSTCATTCVTTTLGGLVEQGQDFPIMVILAMIALVVAIVVIQMRRRR